MFYVGQKVVCVRALPNAVEFPPWSALNVTEGAIYTVRGLMRCPASHEEGVYLQEKINRLNSFYQIEFAYPKENFRPLVEGKQEISFTTGADPSTDWFDNRRKQREKV
jgi:hypothetical protein